MLIPEAIAPYLVLLLIVGVFVAFVRERFSPDVIAVGAIAILLALGILDAHEVLAVFGNSGPITIACMFVISGALVRTGTIDQLGRLVGNVVEKSPLLGLIVLLVGVMVFSAFMNNTPIVIVLMPVVISLASKLEQAPSRLLIPLSYSAILGGTSTMIGTSTNLLVDGVARSHNMVPFGMFEISLIGVAISALGLVFLLVFGRWLLPVRETVAMIMGGQRAPRFLTEVFIPEGSPLIGRPIVETSLYQRGENRIVDVIRHNDSLYRQMDSLTLEAGDRVVLKTDAGEVVNLREEEGVSVGAQGDLEQLASEKAVIFEGVISPTSELVGRKAANVRFRRRYRVYLLAVHRRGRNVGRNLDDLVFEVGDTVMIEGVAADVRRFSEAVDLSNITEPAVRAFRRDKAPIAIGVMAAVMVLAALNVLPIAALAMIGVAVVFLTGCVDAEEGYKLIDWRIMMLIFGMLGIGTAMEKTGALDLMVAGITPWLMDASPLMMLAAVYLIGALLTELVTNNAVAVLLTPVALALAEQMGYDPRPFVVAVMFSASASFATPIGYQTNTMVYSAGGYKFTDFLRIGIPMNLMVAAVVIFLIPMIWPLQ